MKFAFSEKAHAERAAAAESGFAFGKVRFASEPAGGIFGSLARALPLQSGKVSALRKVGMRVVPRTFASVPEKFSETVFYLQNQSYYIKKEAFPF